MPYADKARARAVTARWRAEHPEETRRDQRRHKLKAYGLTLDGYDRLLEEQGGVCAICLGGPKRRESLHVDHDHATGIVRGLLCGHCNRALGLLADNPASFERAAEYLRDNPRLVAFWMGKP